AEIQDAPAAGRAPRAPRRKDTADARRVLEPAAAPGTLYGGGESRQGRSCSRQAPERDRNVARPGVRKRRSTNHAHADPLLKPSKAGRSANQRKKASGGDSHASFTSSR